MTDLRKETLEAILRQGGRNTHTNEARDMAAECLRRRAGGVSTQEAAERVIADLRSKGLAAWADDLADHYGLPKTAKPPVGYYPYMVPFRVDVPGKSVPDLGWYQGKVDEDVVREVVAECPHPERHRGYCVACNHYA